MQKNESAFQIKDVVTNLPSCKSLFFKNKIITLKEIIITADKEIKEAVCFEMISNNIIFILFDYIKKDLDDKLVQSKSLEFLLFIFSILSKGTDADVKLKWSKYNKKNIWLKFISDILQLIPHETKSSIQLLLKTHLKVTEYESIIKNEAFNYKSNIDVLIVLLNDFRDNEEAIQIILDIAIKITQGSKIKEYLNKNNKSEIEDKSNANVNCIMPLVSVSSSAIDFKQLIHNILILASQAKDQRTLFNSVECLENILKFQENLELIRQENIISTTALILHNFPNELYISSKFREILLQIITKDDLFVLIEFIKAKSISDINLNLDSYKVIQEIPQVLFDKTDKETFAKFKQNSIKILLLIIQDAKVLIYLRELNSLESIVLLLKNSCQGDKENSMNMRTLLNVILSLAKKYEDEYDFETSEISQKVLQNILLCCFKAVMIEYDDDELFNKIMSYLKQKFKLSNIKSILKNIPTEVINIFFITVYNKYYNQSWILTYLHQIPLSLVDKSPSNEFKQQCDDLYKEIEIIKTAESKGLTSSQMNQLLYLMNIISIKLSFGIVASTQSNDKDSILPLEVGEQMIYLLNKSISMIFNDITSAVNYTELFQQFIPLLFNSLENPNMMHKKQLCEAIHFFINKLLYLNDIDTKIIEHLLMRLIRITKADTGNLNMLLFSNEAILSFVLYCLSLNEYTDKIVNKLFEVISAVLLSSLNNSQIVALFLYQNGFSKMLQLGINTRYQTIKNKTCLLKILQTISHSYLTQFNDMYNNIVSCLKLVTVIKEMSYKSKATNTLCYYEVLLLFEKMLLKNSISRDVVEYSALLSFFINEANSVIIDNDVKLLLMLFKILGLITYPLNNSMMLIDNDLFDLINQVLSMITINKEISNFDPLLFNEIIKILSHINKDANEYNYSNKSYLRMVKSIQNILMKKNALLDKKTIDACLDLFRIWLINETSKEWHLKERRFSSGYLKELVLQFPKSCQDIKSKIGNLIDLLDKSQMTQKEIDDEYIDLETELLQLLVIDNKNKIWRSSSEMECKSDTNQQEHIFQTNFHKRKTMRHISNNPRLESYFKKIFMNIKQLISLSEKRIKKEKPIEKECMKIVKLLQIIKLFLKDGENKQELFEEDIMNSLIEIMSSSIFLSFVKNEVYLLLYSAMKTEIDVSKVLINLVACSFFVNDIISIRENYLINESDLLHNKVSMTTKLMSYLTTNKGFVDSNCKEINVEIVMVILENIQSDKSIIMNLLTITINILTLDKQNSIKYIENNLVFFCRMVSSLWSSNKTDIRLIELILMIIERTKDYREIVDKLSEYKLKELINEALMLDKSDFTFITNVLNLINTLALSHAPFSRSILDATGIQNIIKAANDNISNTKIIEYSLSIFSTAICYSQENIITNLGLYGLNEYCLSLLKKYMITCHNAIISKTISLIKTLTTEDYNIKLLSAKHNIEIIQKLYIQNYANEVFIKELIVIILKILTNKNIIEDNSFNSIKSVEESEMKKGQAIQNFSITLMIKMINLSFINYNNHEKIVKNILKITNILFKQTHESSIKQLYIDTVIELFASLFPKTTSESIEIIFKYINNMIIPEETQCYFKSLMRIIEVIDLVLSKEDKLNKNIVRNCLEIIKSIIKGDQTRSVLNSDAILSTLNKFKEKEALHDEMTMMLFSDIMHLLHLLKVKEIPIDLLMFISGYLEKITMSKMNEVFYQKHLGNIASISEHFFISNSDDALYLGRLLLSLLKMNLKNDKNMVNLYMITSQLIEHSEVFRCEMIQSSLNAIREIQDITSMHNQNNSFLKYQAKLCLTNLENKCTKIDDKAQNATSIQIESKMETQELLVRGIKGDMYTDQGDVRKVTFQIDNDAKVIRIIEQNKEISKMKLIDMSNCVKGISSESFAKAIKSLKLFAKKPSSKKSLSIISKRNNNRQGKEFDIQCESEDQCNTIVEYLLTIIKNYSSSYQSNNQ